MELRLHSRTTLRLQVASADDAWAVRQLFGALHRFNATLDARFALGVGWEAVLDEHLAHGRLTRHSLVLLAWQGAEPVGLLMMDGHSDSPLFRHRHWAELLALYVIPEQRGSGLAERLLDAGARWAQERGYERIQLYVTATNLPARRFYARSGFHPVQEIWRLELGASAGYPPEDERCASDYTHGQHLVAPRAHPIGGEAEENQHNGALE
jgi:ribosomal protein S18 acetylase RimI-like enzyme